MWGQVVIKYVPYVGDSKRALDEYTSEIFMGGRNTIAMHNTCEDSLLATPLIYDLVILAELCERIKVRWSNGTALACVLSSCPLLPVLARSFGAIYIGVPPPVSFSSRPLIPENRPDFRTLSSSLSLSQHPSPD